MQSGLEFWVPHVAAMEQESVVRIPAQRDRRFRTNVTEHSD